MDLRALRKVTPHVEDGISSGTRMNQAFSNGGTIDSSSQRKIRICPHCIHRNFFLFGCSPGWVGRPSSTYPFKAPTQRLWACASAASSLRATTASHCLSVCTLELVLKYLLSALILNFIFSLTSTHRTPAVCLVHSQYSGGHKNMRRDRNIELPASLGRRDVSIGCLRQWGPEEIWDFPNECICCFKCRIQGRWKTQQLGHKWRGRNPGWCPGTASYPQPADLVTSLSQQVPVSPHAK